MKPRKPGCIPRWTACRWQGSGLSRALLRRGPQQSVA
jgi:hypothetical protein